METEWGVKTWEGNLLFTMIFTDETKGKWKGTSPSVWSDECNTKELMRQLEKFIEQQRIPSQPNNTNAENMFQDLCNFADAEKWDKVSGTHIRATLFDFEFSIIPGPQPVVWTNTQFTQYHDTCTIQQFKNRITRWIIEYGGYKQVLNKITEGIRGYSFEIRPDEYYTWTIPNVAISFKWKNKTLSISRDSKKNWKPCTSAELLDTVQKQLNVKGNVQWGTILRVINHLIAANSSA